MPRIKPEPLGRGANEWMTPLVQYHPTNPVFNLLENSYTNGLLSLCGPHPGRGILRACDQHAAVFGQGHAVDGLLMVAQRLFQGPIPVA